MSKGESVFKKFSQKFPATLTCQRVLLPDQAFNDGFGGGFPVGKQVVFFSKEGVGKSTVALSVCKAFCEQDKSCVYLDFEGSLTESLIESMGLGKYLGESFFVHQNIFTYTHLQELTDAYMDSGISLMVVDSEAAVVPEKLIESDAESTLTGTKARLTTDFILRFNSKWRQRDISVLWIQQMRAKFNTGFSSWGAENEECAGSKAFKYMADFMVEFKLRKTLYTDEKGVYGSQVQLVFKKNKTALRKKVITTITYGTGFDPLVSLIGVLERNELISQKGPYYVVNGLLSDGEDAKCKGKDALEVFLKENLDAIIASLKEKGLIGDGGEVQEEAEE